MTTCGTLECTYSSLGDLLQVATAVREHQQRREESSRRVERANLGLTVLVKKLERSLFVSEL